MFVSRRVELFVVTSCLFSGKTKKGKMKKLLWNIIKIKLLLNLIIIKCEILKKEENFGKLIYNKNGNVTLTGK